jgi:hypothetical protein
MLVPEVAVRVPPGGLIDVQGDKVNDVQCYIGAYRHVCLQDAALRFGDVGQEGVEEHVLVRAGDSVTYVRAVMPAGARERAVPDAGLDECNEAWPGVRRDQRLSELARQENWPSAKMPDRKPGCRVTASRIGFLEPRREVTLPGRLAFMP